jgi:hypothetical protein
MMMSLGPISITKQASAHFPTIQPVTPMPSTRMSLLSMFQQQYTGVVQRDKTEGRATDSLAIVLWRSTIAAVELSQSDWPSDFGVEYSFRDRKHLVFALGTIL